MSKYSNIFLLSDAEYENIGEHLRLRKYGSWLAEETWKREEQTQKRAHFTLRTIALAKKIAAEKEVGEEEAFAMLQGDAKENSIFSEYTTDALELMSAMPSAKAQLGELITIFFRNRGEILNGKKWSATDDWTIEDTEKLTDAWIEQIEAFMAAENRNETQPKNEDEDAEEESKN